MYTEGVPVTLVSRRRRRHILNQFLFIYLGIQFFFLIIHVMRIGCTINL